MSGNDDNELYEIDKKTAQSYMLGIAPPQGMTVVCCQHNRYKEGFPWKVCTTVWDALEWIEEHEREAHE